MDAPFRSFITPPPMQPGDKVAIVAPSSGLAAEFHDVFKLGVSRGRDLFDLDPVIFPTARQGSGFLTDHPRARAADIHAAFRNPRIKGVIATIGGSDQIRVLDYLDSDMLRENPTRFYGMSDNTNIGLCLWRAGLVSYNGGQLMNELAVKGSLPTYTERFVRRAFFGESMGELEPSDEWSDEPTEWWSDETLPESSPTYEPNTGWEWYGQSVRVNGPLWGGCRSVVDQHLRTERFLPPTDKLEGTILALELSTECPKPKDVASSLKRLGERGLLERFAGVIVGRTPAQNLEHQPSRAEQTRYRDSIRMVIRREIAHYNPDIPLVFGLDWGHTIPTVPLPLGANITINALEKRIAFEQQ